MKIEFSRKAILLFATLIIVVLASSFFFYEREKSFQNQILYQMEENKNFGKGKSKDYYKDIAIKNTLKKRETEIQKCYKDLLLRKPTPTDSFLELDWTVQENGTTSGVEIIQTNMNDEFFLDCVVNILNKIKFPPPPRGMPEYVYHKYLFKNLDDKKK